MSLRLNPAVMSRSIHFGRSAEPSPSIEKTAKNPSFLEWIGQKLPISNQADDLITAYQGEVIPHRAITPEERKILEEAAQNWTPLSGGPEKVIVPPTRPSSVAALGTTTAATAAGAAAGKFVPSAETDLRAIDNFVWHKTLPVDTSLPSASPPALETDALSEGVKTLTEQAQEPLHRSLFHWHARPPILSEPPHLDPVDLTKAGVAAGGAGLAAKGAAATGTLATAKAGAALTGWGLGASAGLGVGIVSSLIIAPLIALSQHVQNRNIMAAMAKIYDNPPEVVPAADGAPPSAPPPPPSIPVKNAGHPLEPLTDKVQETVQGWASKLPSWLPLSNDPSGLTRDFEKISGHKPEPHQEKALQAASNNWLPPVVATLGDHEEETIVRPDKAGVGVAHAVALSAPVVAAPISALPWLAEKAINGLAFVLSPIKLGGPLTWVASQLDKGLAGIAAATGGSKVFLIPFLSPIAAKAGIVAGVIAAPIAAYAQHIRNRNIMAAWAESDKPANAPEEKSTPTTLKLLKDNGPFKDLSFDGRFNKPDGNKLNKAFNTTGIINP